MMNGFEYSISLDKILYYNYNYLHVCDFDRTSQINFVLDVLWDAVYFSPMDLPHYENPRHHQNQHDLVHNQWEFFCFLYMKEIHRSMS